MSQELHAGREIVRLWAGGDKMAGSMMGRG